MTSPLLVVQNNLVERLTGPAARAARDLDIAVHDISSGKGDGALANPLPRDGLWRPILVIGSVLFVRQWAGSRADLLPWIDWDDGNYDPELWSRLLGPRFLNYAGRATTVAQLIRDDAPLLHLRPRSGVKLMGRHVLDENHEGRMPVAGGVVNSTELHRLRVDPDTRVWSLAPARN